MKTKSTGKVSQDEIVPNVSQHQNQQGRKKKSRRGGGGNKQKKLRKVIMDEERLSMVPEDIRFRPELHKYYLARKELFRKFNKGIKLDAESWFSVTPEMNARHIALRCKRDDGIILDAFCGCGGNTIQFARQCAKVIAIDIDPVKIDYCRHNARIYGVEDKIEFIVGDFTKLAATVKADVVFLSPPWGGPEYTLEAKFDIKTMIPQDGEKLFELASTISPNIAYYLPRNVDKDQITRLAGKGNRVDIETCYFKKKMKAITAYYGDLIPTQESSLTA